jgi:hypothetical protein
MSPQGSQRAYAWSCRERRTEVHLTSTHHLRPHAMHTLCHIFVRRVQSGVTRGGSVSTRGLFIFVAVLFSEQKKNVIGVDCAEWAVPSLTTSARPRPCMRDHTHSAFAGGFCTFAGSFTGFVSHYGVADEWGLDELPPTFLARFAHVHVGG